MEEVMIQGLGGKDKVSGGEGKKKGERDGGRERGREAAITLTEQQVQR